MLKGTEGGGGRERFGGLETNQEGVLGTGKGDERMGGGVPGCRRVAECVQCTAY